MKKTTPKNANIPKDAMKKWYGDGTFGEAFYSVAILGDVEPLIAYLKSDKPLDSEMKVRLAELLSGEHESQFITTSDVKLGPFDLVPQLRKKPPHRTSDPEVEEERYRQGAEKIYFLVRCKRMPLDTAFEQVRADRHLGDRGRLRATLRRVEEDFEDVLPRERGPYAQKPRVAKPKKQTITKRRS